MIDISIGSEPLETPNKGFQIGDLKEMTKTGHPFIYPPSADTEGPSPASQQTTTQNGMGKDTGDYVG